jgi:hypothetical protein
MTDEEDEDYVASMHLPEFKVNLSPSDIRKKAAINRAKTTKINICFMKTGQICGKPMWIHKSSYNDTFL